MFQNIAGWVADGVDPDQTPHFEMADPGLHFMLKPVCPKT